MKQVRLYDTTLRDGAQGMGVSFSLADKIRIAIELDQIGIDYVEGGWPGSNPKDIEFFNQIKKIKFKNARIAAFSSTRRCKIKIEADHNIRQLVHSQTPVFTIFGKSWDLHVADALATDPQENLDMIHDTISYLKKYADEIIYDAEHFFDGFKSNPDYALKTLKTAEAAGADTIVLCDTNGGTLWYELESIIDRIMRAIKIPLGIHAHNDSDQAVVNSLIAVKKGFTQVQGTINGLGERCGNANLCSIMPNLNTKMHIKTIADDDLKKLTSLSRLVSELINRPPAPNLPFVGENAFAHKGGVHVSAVRKNSKTYEHIDPEIVGNKRTVLVSELSGRSNLLEKAAELKIDLSDRSLVSGLLDKLKQLEAKGYYFEGADASLELLIRSSLDQVSNYFSLEGFHVIIWKNSHTKAAQAEASIKVSVPDEVAQYGGFEEAIEHTSADGSGPVEALDRALRKILEKFYPRLKSLKLTDYKVRILDERSGTKATTRVLIYFTDGKNKWGTVGVSNNIIEASWIALTDAFTYKLMKDEITFGCKNYSKSRVDPQ